MRAGQRFLVCAFLVVAASAASAQSCATSAAVPKRSLDRTWIKNDTFFYGADARGVFRLGLGSNRIERIGAHAGEPIANLHLSPQKHWLAYEQTGPAGYWLYDTANNREHQIDVQSSGGAELQFSPDETQVAWLERSNAAHRLIVLDLRVFKTQSFRLLDAPDPKAVFFGLTWSMKGDAVTYAWRDAERQEFYSLDPKTGIARSIPPLREFAADEFVEGSYLLGEGEVPRTRPLARAGKDTIALERGAVVRSANGKIIVSSPRTKSRTIAEISPKSGSDCRPEVTLLDAFDGRYVLYRFNSDYWIYGLRENRKAILFSGAGMVEW